MPMNGDEWDTSEDEARDDIEPRRDVSPSENLASLTLREVLDLYRQGRGESDDAHYVKVVGIRDAPVGFRVIMDLRGDEEFVSYSRLALCASAHGLALLEGEPIIRRCIQVHRRAGSAALVADDDGAMARLGRTTVYSFQRAELERTTFPVWKSVHARMVRLALACGISPARLAVLCIVASLLKGNGRRYLDRLEREIQAFLRHVEHRVRVLELEP